MYAGEHDFSGTFTRRYVNENFVTEVLNRPSQIFVVYTGELQGLRCAANYQLHGVERFAPNNPLFGFHRNSYSPWMLFSTHAHILF